MSLNDLSSAPLKDDVDVNHLPEQLGGFTPPPPPGAYRFKLSPLTLDNFEKVDDAKFGERVRVRFDEKAPLIIVQAPHAPDRLQTPFEATLTNVPRRRGKAEDAPVAADWDYLNRALKLTARPTSNRDYATQLMTKASERAEFSADIEWGWNCNATRAARFDDGNGSTQEVLDQDTQQPKKGCGTRYYEKDVEKVEGAFPLRITCSCGATVRAFPNLTRFRV